MMVRTAKNWRRQNASDSFDGPRYRRVLIRENCTASWSAS
jgi:hypothetical protein